MTSLLEFDKSCQVYVISNLINQCDRFCQVCLTLSNFLDFVNYGNVKDAEVEYIEDCFDDIERPRFGWRAKVTFMENEPCNVDFENPEQSTCRVPSNSDGEAEANFYAQSRQTGENFRSAAPADCRVEVCSSTLDDDYDYDDYYDDIKRRYN